MPLREFGCPSCGTIAEIYHPSIDIDKVPAPLCCHKAMKILYSTPNLDTSSSFKAFDIKIEGQSFRINNLHELRAVEKSFSHKNLRFDAYSENPSSDAYGPAYNPRDDEAPHQVPKKGYGLPTVKD